MIVSLLRKHYVQTEILYQYHDFLHNEMNQHGSAAQHDETLLHVEQQEIVIAKYVHIMTNEYGRVLHLHVLV